MPLSLNQVDGSSVPIPQNLEEVDAECIKVKKGLLTTLNLSYYGIKDIPQIVYSMGEHVTRLTCGGNRIESISEEIGSFSKLSVLNLWSNKLTSLPNSIGGLAQLNTLSLFDNLLITLPPTFKNLTSLTELHLSRNPFNSLPIEIGSLKSLTLLKLQKCNLSTIPKELSNLTNLIHLDLSENNLQNGFPSSIFKLSNLEVLELQYNKIASLLPDPDVNDEIETFDGASASASASASENEDPIPSWSRLAKLKTLVLFENNINEIPPNTVSLLPHLETLSLSQNNVQNLPHDIQHNSSLTNLDLSLNGIVELPASISLLTNLRQLDVSYNSIEHLPNFEGLPNLLRVVVTGNKYRECGVVSRCGSQTIIIGNSKEDEPNLILEKLYLGNARCARDKWRLKEMGITHILTVASRIPPPYPNDFEYQVVNVTDTESDDLLTQFPICKEFIERGRNHGGVLVHCQAGISRSATITIMYTMIDKGLSHTEAFDYVRERRPIICPNQGFRDQIRKFDAQLKKLRGDTCIIS